MKIKRFSCFFCRKLYILIKSVKQRILATNKLKKGDRNKTTQDWLPFDKILENGIIISKNKYIKIIKIIPINYDLKSNLEKEAILNSYKLFLKTCDFNIQIIIQSKKENLSKYFYNLKEISEKEENQKLKDLIEKYIEFIKNKNELNKAASKNFYIVVKYVFDEKKKDINFNENLALNYLKECYLKIKETLSRCGNTIYEINSRSEAEIILNSFLNPKFKEKK